LFRKIRPMRRVVLFGGPGAGAIVAQSIAALAAGGHAIALHGFLNDALPRGTQVCGAPVLGPFAIWQELPDDVVFLAPLHNAKDMPSRVEIIKRCGVPNDRWATVVDPSSAVAPDAAIGPGCFIAPFTTVGPDARLGAHCIVRAGAHVSHDCSIGDFVFVGANAVVCGCCTLSDGAYIAPNATIRDRCRIGRFAVVGLGSVVLGDVEDFLIVAGTPAKQIGHVNAVRNIVVPDKLTPAHRLEDG
jgi:sugar O-acyltransferase (sialic acid O-acetyltransferase NeuD family)